MMRARNLVAALLIATLPLVSNAQSSTLEAGDIPADWAEYARALAASNRDREAIAAYEHALQDGKSHAGENAWNIARLYAKIGNKKQSLRWLAQAVEQGYASRDTIVQAPEFSRFRNDPKMSELLRTVVVSNVRISLLTSF